MYCKGVPKIVDHEQRRTEIIHALWQVIYEQGIHAASYQTVARAAGISVGRIQHYFTSKQDLVRAGCQAIVDTAESVHFGRTEALEPFDALTELLTQPIPRNNAFRLGNPGWDAHLAPASRGSTPRLSCPSTMAWRTFTKRTAPICRATPGYASLRPFVGWRHVRFSSRCPSSKMVF